MKKYWSLLIAGLILLAVAGAIKVCEKQTTSAKSDVYRDFRGQFQGYSVFIIELEKKGKIDFRVVILSSLDKGNTPYEIYGHDDDSNGTWEKVRFKRQPSDTKAVTRIFRNPDGSYKFKGAPVSISELNKVLGLLDGAFKTVHREDHLAWKF